MLYLMLLCLMLGTHDHQERILWQYLRLLCSLTQGCIHKQNPGMARIQMRQGKRWPASAVRPLLLNTVEELPPLCPLMQRRSGSKHGGFNIMLHCQRLEVHTIATGNHNSVLAALDS